MVCIEQWSGARQAVRGRLGQHTMADASIALFEQLHKGEGTELPWNNLGWPGPVKNKRDTFGDASEVLVDRSDQVSVKDLAHSDDESQSHEYDNMDVAVAGEVAETEAAVAIQAATRRWNVVRPPPVSDTRRRAQRRAHQHGILALMFNTTRGVTKM